MPVYRFDVGKSRAAILVSRAQSRRGGVQTEWDLALCRCVHIDRAIAVA